MFVLLKNIQGGEQNIIGQRKVMRLDWNMHRQQRSERSKHIWSKWTFHLKMFTQMH